MKEGERNNNSHQDSQIRVHVSFNEKTITDTENSVFRTQLLTAQSANQKAKLQYSQPRTEYLQLELRICGLRVRNGKPEDELRDINGETSKHKSTLVLILISLMMFQCNRQNFGPTKLILQIN